ncbi:hypothetical protein [Rhodanobacter geophilus]|uniref:Uncharacterized protein n=1 Tax=Rhodanobacter geophilus TaxID=3162488 RepID=A0ABV3QQA7_9GAMM
MDLTRRSTAETRFMAQPPQDRDTVAYGDAHCWPSRRRAPATRRSWRWTTAGSWRWALKARACGKPESVFCEVKYALPRDAVDDRL